MANRGDMVRILLILLIVPFVSFGQANRMGGFGYRSTTGYYRSITIDHTKVPSNQDSVTIVWRSPVGTVNTVGTAVTLASGDNFPTWMTDSIMINGVVYKVSSITTGTALVLTASAGTQTGVAYNGTPYLRHQDYGGKVKDADGDDIIVATDNAGSSLCKWNVETYTATTGVTVLHILFPTISSSVDDVRYLRYGGTQTTFQGGSTGAAYVSTAKMVQHFNQPKTAAGQTITDATSNALNLTTQGSSWGAGQTAAGVIGDATSCIKANGNYLSFTQQTLSGDFTLAAWIKISVQNQNSVWFGRNDFEDDFNWYAGYGRYYDGGADIFASSTQTPTATWEYFVITRSGTSIVLYENATSHATATSSFSIVMDQLAKQRNYATSEDIVYDEFQYYSTSRTNDWATTMYNNQNSPQTFYSVGAQN